MMQIQVKQYVIFLVVNFILCSQAAGQFIDDFNDGELVKDSRAINGWAYFTGDGGAKMDFVQGDGFASVMVDSTRDKRNIWWALIKHSVSADMNLGQISDGGCEFRIEARIRASDAPRRVNLHLNTQRTTDFHSHLVEFDIPDTKDWHTISMTTKGFDARPGDTVFGQMALMDWGVGKYRVDVDYMRVDIVNPATAGPDKGGPMAYRPPVPDVNSFANVVKVAQDSTVDTEYTEMNFNGWCAKQEGEKVNLLSVGGTQIAIMRWDLGEFAGKRIADVGLLELTTYSVERLAEEVKDFGMIRVVEILGGEKKWEQGKVTYEGLLDGQAEKEVFNSQMIIDCEVNEKRGGRTYVTISRPVLQRMIDGRTVGIAVRPLGAIKASFYSMENLTRELNARLHFNTE